MNLELDTPEILKVLDGYRTCEFATVGRSGVPIAWPTAPLYRPGEGLIITTSIGFPQKAFNVRRNPKVGLLFSDSTGSGLHQTPQVLIQGNATCSDEITVSPAGLEDYWVRLLERQPAGRGYAANPVGRAVMSWYYQRLVITVTPTTVHTRSPADVAPATPPASLLGTGKDPLAKTVSKLAGFHSAVLVGLDATGTPWLLRVRPEADLAARLLMLEVPDNERLVAGPASLLCHSHDDKLWKLRSFVVTGTVAERDGRWAFSCERVIDGADGNPLHTLRMLRGCRRSARDYLRRRNQPPPTVSWAEFEAVKETVLRREAAASGR